MNVEVNDIYEPVTDDAIINSLVRILWVSQRDNLAALIVMANKNVKQPFTLRLSDLVKSIENGDVKKAKVKTPPYLMVLEDALTTQQKEDRDKKWAIISPIVNHEDSALPFLPGELWPMVTARGLEVGVQRRQILRLVYRYWINGQIKNALLKDYVNVGKSARIYLPNKRPGPKPAYQGVLSEQHKLLEAADIKCIKLGYALFVNDEKASRRDAYDKMLAKFYKEKDLSKQPESVGRLLPDSEIPSYRQFVSQGKKLYDEVATERGRMGEKNWLKDRRPLTGTVRDNLRGPCHQFEIDSTVADIYLVNSYNRHMLIGRPIIYVVVDSYSGMIVGLYVGLEGPSWNGARQALFNAFTSKKEFCELNGIIIDDEAWPCHHLPHEVFADRAEMLGEGAEGLSSGLNVDIGIAPPYRPDWKSMVESRFNILNKLSGIRWLPGGVAARVKERGERDYRLDATLNMREFTSIIIKCVLHYNSFNRQPERLTKLMREDEIEPTPLSIWKWAMENDFMLPNKKSEDLVYLHLLPRDNATVRKGGIYFRGMHYVSDYVINNNWLAKSRSQGRWTIPCWYHPNTVSSIWIQDPQKQFVRCSLRRSDQQYENYRSDEIFDMLEAERQIPPQHKRAELESRVSLVDEMEGIINTAQCEKQQSPAPATKAEKIGNMRVNRAEELALERESENTPVSIFADKKPSTPSVPAGRSDHFAGARSAQIIDILKGIRPGQKS